MVTAQQLTYVSVHRASVSSLALAVDKDWQKEEPRNDTCLLSMMTMHLCHLVLRNHHWHTKMRNPEIIKWPAREKIGMSCRNMNLINPEIWLRCKNPLHLIGFGPVHVEKDLRCYKEWFAKSDQGKTVPHSTINTLRCLIPFILV